MSAALRTLNFPLALFTRLALDILEAVYTVFNGFCSLAFSHANAQCDVCKCVCQGDCLLLHMALPGSHIEEEIVFAYAGVYGQASGALLLFRHQVQFFVYIIYTYMYTMYT